MEALNASAVSVCTNAYSRHQKGASDLVLLVDLNTGLDNILGRESKIYFCTPFWRSQKMAHFAE